MIDTLPFVSSLNETETQSWLDALQKAMPEINILPLSRLSQSERHACPLAIVANPDPSDLIALPNLKWVQSLWAGVENLINGLAETSIQIVRMNDPQLAKSMAEAVLAWALYLHRDMPLYRQQQNNKHWRPHEVSVTSETTIGVLGLGDLGKASAQMLAGHGFKVCGWSRTPVRLDGVKTFAGMPSLDAVLRQSDILIVLLPLTDETRNLLGHNNLARLPKGASIINFARGALLDESALVSCLDKGAIKHAVLDVFDREPLPLENVLWAHPAITILPHISAPTNKKTASRIVAQNIDTFFNKNIIPKSVDRSRGY